MELHLKTNAHIHFVGIKGVAMAALAVWAKEAGYRVTGSDVRETFPTDEILAKAGLVIIPDFDPRNVSGEHKPDLVIYTGAHGGSGNDEVVEAKALGVPVLPHGAALGWVMKDARQISVAGSHGKTTTSAMIATILMHAGRNPSYAVGCGEIRGLGLPGHHGNGDLFVAEADEYVTDPTHDPTPRFLWQHPDILVVTNIDFDHPDAYADLAAVQEAFVRLRHGERGMRLTVVNADDSASGVLRGEGDGEIVTYGFSKDADFQVTHVGFGNERTFFTLKQRGMYVGDFSLKVPGRHNAVNAAAAAIACHRLGLPWQDIAKGLLQFEGTKRRFERVGSVGSVRVIDDYAHHPKEIEATIAAAREWYPGHRIIAVFQPHTYSRTKALLPDFASAFGQANEVLLTTIYASAREKDTLGISAQTLVTATLAHNSNTYFAPDFAAVGRWLRAHMRDNDVILFMGAGSIYTWGRDFVKNETGAL